MQQLKQVEIPDAVAFRNGVWVIVEKSTAENYGFSHGPYQTRKLAAAALAKGKQPTHRPARRNNGKGK